MYNDFASNEPATKVELGFTPLRILNIDPDKEVSKLKKLQLLNNEKKMLLLKNLFSKSNLMLLHHTPG